MSYKNRYQNRNREFEIDEAKTAEFCKNTISKIETQEDIEILSELFKLYKKNVPLSRRKYVIACLLKEELQHFHYYPKNSKNESGTGKNRSKNERSQKSEKYSKSFQGEKTDFFNSTEETEIHHRRPHVEIEDSESTTIFVNIGKNKGVRPGDFIGLLTGVANIDRERIGGIKVLTNYSFVQLYKDDAPKAIEKLNAYKYRGRKLSVNYSIKKDGSESDLDANDENKSFSSEENFYAENQNFSENSQNQMDEEMSAEDAAAYAAAEKAAKDKTPFSSF